jgi:anti-sigma regulatory factor (Ser/Thr protein kinase)
VDWCHIDAYDDVPLTTVVRTGEALSSGLDALGQRFSGFVERQREQGTVAIAAAPLPGSSAPLGAVILYYEAAQPFGDAQRAELVDLAGRLAAEVRAAQAVTPRQAASLADEPVEPDSLVADLVVAGDPAEVGRVRGWVRTSLRAWDVDDDTVGDAVLCVSELVTNAVMHTRSGCEVRLLAEPGLLTVAVRDHGRPGPPLGGELPEDPLRVHGRGLQVVGALSTRWGSGRDASGTTVWFARETTATGRLVG